MITIKETKIKEDSLAYNLSYDYSDTFECCFVTNKKITADDVLIAFWSKQPAWVKKLFKLRNSLVKPFKLYSDNSNFSEKLKKVIETGETDGMASITAKSENETILQMDDKHLIFHMSVQVKEKSQNQKHIIASTLVSYHNVLGKCYFTIICPFHKIIVRSMLKYIVKTL